MIVEVSLLCILVVGFIQKYILARWDNIHIICECILLHPSYYTKLTKKPRKSVIFWTKNTLVWFAMTTMSANINVKMHWTVGHSS